MNKAGLDSLLASHTMFLDSRASDTRRDRLEVLCNSHAEPGTQLRMSLCEFTCPNLDVLDQAVFPDGTQGVGTIYLRVDGASLANRESQHLGAAPNAPPHPELFTSSILAKIGVERTNPTAYQVFYPPNERTASVIVPNSHLGSFTVRLTDSSGNSLSDVNGLAPFFGVNGTSFFSCSLRIDTVRVNENDGGSLMEPKSGIHPRFDGIDHLAGKQPPEDMLRQYMA